MEKIEVIIGEGIRPFYYTGELVDLGDGWVEIRTERGEILKYRKEQIVQRTVLDDN